VIALALDHVRGSRAAFGRMWYSTIAGSLSPPRETLRGFRIPGFWMRNHSVLRWPKNPSRTVLSRHVPLEDIDWVSPVLRSFFRRRRDGPIVVEIEDGRQVDPRAPDSELGHVRSPLRVPKFCRELTVQHVIGRFADLIPEGVVTFATTYRALQPELTPRFEHGLLGYPPSLLAEDREDTPVRVCAVCRLECITGSFSNIGPGVPATEPPPVAVEREPLQFRNLQ